MRKLFISCCAKLILAILCLATTIIYAGNQAMVLKINQAISPAAEEYILSGLNEAARQQVNVIIIQLDTPGGLSTTTHNINKAILVSPTPVVTYVSPTGARAASAGTFILYASAIAAMAPGTNIGAASPVNIGSESSTPPPTSVKNAINAKNLSTLEQKTMNDAVASIQSLAELHHRNSAWAELAVRQAASLSATKALQLHVIDIIATDIPDLLKQLNGRRVIVNGSEQTLQTNNLTITTINPDWRYHFLAIISDPNIAYILFLIGIYGLFFEFYNPGLILPGVVGAISLLIALYAYELLPVNYAGFALLLLGIAFLVIEVIISSFGILGLGGLVAFVTGSILLLDIQGPGYQIAWSLIVIMTIVTLGFFILAIGASVTAMKKQVVTGSEALIGAEGTVLEYTNHLWYVKIRGENWLANSKQPLTIGQSIRVTKISGLTLIVEPVHKIHTRSINRIMD